MKVWVYRDTLNTDDAWQWAEILHGKPVHPGELLERIRGLIRVGDDFATCSDTVLSCIGYLIRAKEIPLPFCVRYVGSDWARDIQYDTKGDFVEPWPEDGFASIPEAGFHYRFSKMEE